MSLIRVYLFNLYSSSLFLTLVLLSLWLSNSASIFTLPVLIYFSFPSFFLLILSACLQLSVVLAALQEWADGSVIGNASLSLSVSLFISFLCSCISFVLLSSILCRLFTHISCGSFLWILLRHWHQIAVHRLFWPLVVFNWLVIGRMFIYI